MAVVLDGVVMRGKISSVVEGIATFTNIHKYCLRW